MLVSFVCKWYDFTLTTLKRIHGKVMMEGLQLWEKFERFKSRACDKVGFSL